MRLHKTIKYLSAIPGLIITAVLTMWFGLPGLLFGAILGFFGSFVVFEWLHGMMPENRRRTRRSLRNEGLG